MDLGRHRVAMRCDGMTHHSHHIRHGCDAMRCGEMALWFGLGHGGRGLSNQWQVDCDVAMRCPSRRTIALRCDTMRLAIGYLNWHIMRYHKKPSRRDGMRCDGMMGQCLGKGFIGSGRTIAMRCDAMGDWSLNAISCNDRITTIALLWL